MKDETFDAILDVLDNEFYTTKRILRKKTGLASSTVENAVEILLEEEEIERIYVKNDIGSGRPEVAYRKV